MGPLTFRELAIGVVVLEERVEAVITDRERLDADVLADVEDVLRLALRISQEVARTTGAHGGPGITAEDEAHIADTSDRIAGMRKRLDDALRPVTHPPPAVLDQDDGRRTTTPPDDAPHEGAGPPLMDAGTE